MDGDETPVLVQADAEHVGRILDNLINNALTYCVGQPRVTVSVSNLGQPTIAVSDNGVGIPAEKRELVFERFVRLDDALIGPVPGTGLGLYISRELARRHGGSLVLDESAPGKGSRFLLRLPVPRRNEEQQSRPGNGRPQLQVHRGADPVEEPPEQEARTAH
jgi:signal transduction histidine kinase